MVGEPLPLLDESLRIVLGIADAIARMREDPRLGGRLQNPRMGPEPGLGHGSEEHALDELGIDLLQPPLAHEDVVEVGADRLLRARGARLERLEAVQRLVDEAGEPVLDVIE